ncbi:hypothetical protein FO519_009666 [Halicephalobus sp. NKZ332]|nr:hypothetical protein FO519_009666 [Halicephalobus sp. NKZ332]
MGNSLRLLSKIRRKPSIFTTNLYSQTYDGNVGDLSAEEQKQSNNNLLIALFNYESRSDEELSIKEDDIVTLVDGSNEHWWEVRRVSDGKTGYVPRKFVTGIKTLEKDDEVKIMKQCDHPHLVKLYAICTEEEPLYIVLEYLKNGSLLSYLRNIENQISEKAMISMSSQIADAMKYLEEQKIVHRDLAARNVLVGENIGEFPFVKVGDFGLARKLIENGMYRVQNERRFPLKWTAPEVNNDGEFTTKSDVWSFGVLLWEIFSHGKEPYAEFDHSQAFKEVKNGHRMSKPEKCPDEVYYEIMLNCWDEDPGKRPRFESLFWYFGNYYVSSQHNDTSIDENVS